MTANAMTACENRLTEALGKIEALGLDGNTVREHAALYEELGEAGNQFFGKVALNRTNRNLIENVIDQEMTAVVDACTMQMIRKLDTVLKVDQADRTRYLVTVANNTITSLSRGDKRHHDRNITLDDVAWGLLPDNTDLEETVTESMTNRKMADTVLEALAASHKPLQLVSFLATEVQGRGTAEVARDLKARGLRAVLLEAVGEVCRLFSLEPRFFAGAVTHAAREDTRYVDCTEKEMAAKVSRANYTCKETVRKKLRKSQNPAFRDALG